jgi:hypothetical protein
MPDIPLLSAKSIWFRMGGLCGGGGGAVLCQQRPLALASGTLGTVKACVGTCLLRVGDDKWKAAGLNGQDSLIRAVDGRTLWPEFTPKCYLSFPSWDTKVGVTTTAENSEFDSRIRKSFLV